MIHRYTAFDQDGNRHGFTISRGDYIDTPDNRLDGWYVEPEGSMVVCRLGPGYATITAAKAAIDGEEL